VRGIRRWLRRWRGLVRAEAAERVSPGAVRGYSVVLRIEGNWWAGFGSGATACSVACAQDPQTATDVLLEAFESGLTAQR
jgi:hypothetical protein